MDSFELNKIIGAVLGTLLFVMGVGFLAEAIYHPIENRGPGYALPEPEVAEGGAAAEEAPAVPLGVLLASASAERGASAVRKCQSCHTFGEGEANKQGPNLYGIVGNAEAHLEGFAYSDILIQYHGEGRIWTYEDLDAFLENPKAYAPGTKMGFAGVRSPEERADILAYLQTLSASPVPFPEPEAAPAAEEPAAEGEAAPAGEASPDDTISDELTTPAGGGSETTEPAAPAGAVETPTETQTDTNVEGTPVQETTPAAPLSGGNNPATPATNTTGAQPAPTNSQ
ncbi:c-type cytochrome [Devosia sediminis]|uniref:Cytochrome c family protein n=1 Tax=Devosia sediminis TaxID=2798801 RepID=A0A934IPX2_9HYPH|nr:cytochrome c family protein [Devosia sediminis]MBJ3784659.1 cytochrome c family protein [Devosia sediminis]